MKIQIVGLGIVGTAQACLSQKLGHEVVGYDIRKMESHPYCKIIDNYIKDADITFVCTHESVTEGIINNLVKIGHRGIITVRSTFPIGETKKLSKKFGVHICHNPEFLKENTYLDDILNPNVVVIGECCRQHGDMLRKFYESFNKPIYRVNSDTSELIKLTMNAHLSMLITFWNEIDELSTKLGIETKAISDIVKHDKRISNYGNTFFGSPYSGKCLPKDMVHIISSFRSQGLNPKIFDACENFNNDLKKRHSNKINSS